MERDETVALHRESPLRRRKRLRQENSGSHERGRPFENGPEGGGGLQFALHIVAQASVQDPSDGAVGNGSEGVAGPAVVAFGLEGTRVGRDPSCCDVVLPSGKISRLHTVLSVVGEDVCVHDKSHNGTFINGRLVGRGRCSILRHGDVVSFVNPLLPDVQQCSYTLELPPELRNSGAGCGGSGTAGLFHSLQQAGMTRYDIGPSIGQGSFAMVRLGVNTETGGKVAVKILEKQRFFSESAFTSLHMEIEMMRSMDHPNVVRVLDAFEAPEMVALVMEYVQGGDLFDYVVGRGRNPFTEEEARFLFVQLLEAVIYIHGRRIVHCDLKPENVLVDYTPRSPSAPSDVSEASGDPKPALALSVLDHHQDNAKDISPFSVRLKLTDFGVAKYYGDADVDAVDEDGAMESDGENGGGGGVGTARYAAPEQLDGAILAAGKTRGGGAGATLTAAVDLWALGVLLYVLCAGSLPRNPQRAERVAFSRSMASISDCCKDLIQGLMQLDPSKRLQLHEVCTHPWLAGIAIRGSESCQQDDDEMMSVTTILSPRLGRSTRLSGPAGDAKGVSPFAAHQ